MDQKFYKISEETINSVLKYLGNQPYVSVAGFVLALQKAQLIEEPKTEGPKDEEPKRT